MTAVVPTHNRPELMRRAVHSVLAQDYEGTLDIIIVYDRAEPDLSLEQTHGDRNVHVMKNARTPGLAGSRNTGILAATGQFIAFCDDDDQWEPEKLMRQLGAIHDDPHAEFVSTAMLVDYDGTASVRLANTDRVSHSDLVRSRMAMLHSSSFLIRKSALVDGIGLVDETIPQSMAEDWDLLLRASARRPIVNVDEPLVRIQWGATSYFAQQWSVRNESQLWLLEHHPAMKRDPRAAGHAYGKLAFGCAAQRERSEAIRWVGKSLRQNWREPRAYIALAVTSGLVRWQWVLKQLNRRGHGI